jgi:hypothetical protein
MPGDHDAWLHSATVLLVRVKTGRLQNTTFNDPRCFLQLRSSSDYNPEGEEDPAVVSRLAAQLAQQGELGN